MTRTVDCGERTGSVLIPSSKSQAHRMLICAALSQSDSVISCDGISDDIKATADCLSALGAKIDIRGGEISVRPIKNIPGDRIELFCGESGSTLRFLLPVVGALGANAAFHMKGRLSERPLSPLSDELISHGMSITRNSDLLLCGGKLEAGKFSLPGNISSQYISGLLFALPLLSGVSEIEITSDIESEDYIEMTLDSLLLSQIQIVRAERLYGISGDQKYRFPACARVESDWSSAAFFLSMGALSEKGITVRGLDTHSRQGDKRIIDVLRGFGAHIIISEDGITVSRGELRGQTVDARMIPDLVPVVSVVAAAANGRTEIINAGRLRLKESDRLRSVSQMLLSLGGKVTETEDGLIIDGGALHGGTVDSVGDHRIAMSAAVAASVCGSPVTVTDPGCTSKSYPRFWDDLDSLSIADIKE